MMNICPNCNQNYSCSDDNSDFLHSCYDYISSVGSSLAQEDVKVIGDWVDYTGSATVQTTQQQTAGQANIVWGQRPSIENGIRIPQFSPRGKNIQTFRQRGYLHYIPKSNEIGPGPQRQFPEPSSTQQ